MAHRSPVAGQAATWRPDEPSDQAFRAEIRDWLSTELRGEFGALRGRGGPGREHEAFGERLAWDRRLAAGGWTCIGWPASCGGRGASLNQQVIFHQEYARADAPARVGHIGEQLLGPTLIAFGSEQQRAAFLPEIVAVRQLWCQGYSEPEAGSDLAGVRTRAQLDGDDWVLDGHKIWTSLAHLADWCFVLARTEPGSRRQAGLSFLLVPMRGAGVLVRPIRQLTGTSEFNEVHFEGARTAAGNIVGAPGDGWRIAMATLGFERGVATVGQQIGFRRELDAIIELAARNGAIDDPRIRDELTRAAMGLEVMRVGALRTLAAARRGTPGPEASIAKLVWARWHRGLGELAMRVAGASSLAAGPGGLDDRQLLYLFSRADTIYGGSDEVQRNIIAERVLGLPKEPRP